MIVFHRVCYKNFMSVGDTPIEIQLDSCDTTLIIGENGGGKCLRGNTAVKISEDMPEDTRKKLNEFLDSRK